VQVAIADNEMSDFKTDSFVSLSFLVTEWSGGLYISPSMAGSRSGALIAGAWASLMALGLNGMYCY
jgi:glutamate/tyrosine decarboxylase-like PLP-dependent enzyme